MCILKEMERAQKKNELLHQLIKESKILEQEANEEVNKSMIT